MDVMFADLGRSPPPFRPPVDEASAGSAVVLKAPSSAFEALSASPSSASSVDGIP